MVAILIVRRVGILGSEQSTALIVVRIEDIVVGELGLFVMKAPDVEKYHRAFWKELSINPFVCLVLAETIKRAL